MKIIDLLNKIAKGEDVPQKIKYNSYFYIYDEENDFIRENSCICLFGDYIDCYLKETLNEEVEIIEEDKEIEHYDMFDNFTGFGFGGTDKELLHDLENNFVHINEELDYLIKAVNELKKGK